MGNYIQDACGRCQEYLEVDADLDFSLNTNKKKPNIIYFEPPVIEFYKDKDFPHSIESILFYNRKNDSDDKIAIKIKDFNEKEIKWLHPKQFIGDQFDIFVNCINPSKDIMQGELGNCYFLSALSTLPDKYIASLFITKNAEEIIKLKLFHNLQWREVSLDLCFPCENQIPVFSKPKENKLYVMLIEKAWAKINKSYLNTQGLKIPLLSKIRIKYFNIKRIFIFDWMPI